MEEFGLLVHVLMSTWRIEMVGMKFGLAALFTTLVVWSSAWADQGDRQHMGNMMGDMGWGWTIFGPFMMIAFLVIAVIVVVLIVRWLGGTGHGTIPSGKSPIDNLRERFARGEIDKKEFEERRRVLEA